MGSEEKSSLTWFLGRYSHNGFSQSVIWDYFVIKWGSSVLKKWKQTSAQQGAHLNCAWPCPAGCYTHLLTHAYAISTFPFGLTDSFQLCWWFNRSTGERRASWGEPGTGCWVQHKVRVNSRVSVGEQILKSNSYCVFLPVWSGRWAEPRATHWFLPVE